MIEKSIFKDGANKNLTHPVVSSFLFSFKNPPFSI